MSFEKTWQKDRLLPDQLSKPFTSKHINKMSTNSLRYF